MSKHPHILLITCDELRFDFLGCYGGDLIPTPSIDALAAEGLALDAAYAPSPLCLPGRCSLLTGQYPHRLGQITKPSRRQAHRLIPVAPSTPFSPRSFRSNAQKRCSRRVDYSC